MFALAVVPVVVVLDGEASGLGTVAVGPVSTGLVSV